MLIDKCFICGKVTEDNYFCIDHAAELHRLLIGKDNLIKKPDFKQHCHICGEYENREIIEFSNWGYFCDRDIIEAFRKYNK
jgi:hypothetical protein